MEAERGGKTGDKEGRTGTMSGGSGGGGSDRTETGGWGGDIHQAVLVCVCVSRNFPLFYPCEDKMFSQGCEDGDVKMCHSAASTKRSGLRFGVKVETWWMSVEAVLRGIRQVSV